MKHTIYSNIMSPYSIVEINSGLTYVYVAQREGDVV